MQNEIQKRSVLLFTLGTLILAASSIFIGHYIAFRHVSTNDTLVFVILPGLAILFQLLLPFFATKLSPALSRFELVWTKKPRAKIRWYFLLILSIIVVYIFIAFISKKTGLPTRKWGMYNDITKLTLTFFTLIVVRTAILTPIAEEIFWRGFIQDQFTKCFGQTPALFIQAALFSFVHPCFLLGHIHIFLIGLIFGIWRLKRRSLIPIIITHAILNGLFCLGRYPDQYEMSKVNIAVNYVEKINQLGRPASETENANVDYQKAIALYHQPPKKLRDDKLVYSVDQFVELTDEQQQVLEDWIAQNSAALTHFRAGTLKPAYWPEAKGNAMQEADDFKESSLLMELAYACRWNAQISASRGDTKQALDDLLCCLRHGNHLLAGPKRDISFSICSKIHQYTCNNIGRILVQADATAEQLESFQKNIQQIFDNSPSTLDFTWERFTLYDIIQRTFTDDGNGDGHLPKLEIKGMDNKVFKFMSQNASDEEIENWKQSTRKETTVVVDEYFSFMEKRFSKTPNKWRQNNSEPAGDLEERAKNNMIYTYLPHLKSTYQIYHETKAAQQALITTLAVIRYQKISGRLPDTLETLKAGGFLDTLPTDPYSGQPLIYKKEGKGFRLYCIGRDFEDNDGRRNANAENPNKDIIFWPPPDAK